MLQTTCPNCNAQFKVQPEQLNVRQGRVMCGRCRHVFNAFQFLERVTESIQPANVIASETSQQTPSAEAEAKTAAAINFPPASASLHSPVEFDISILQSTPHSTLQSRADEALAAQQAIADSFEESLNSIIEAQSGADQSNVGAVSYAMGQTTTFSTPESLSVAVSAAVSVPQPPATRLEAPPVVQTTIAPALVIEPPAQPTATITEPSATAENTAAAAKPTPPPAFAAPVAPIVPAAPVVLAALPEVFKSTSIQAPITQPSSLLASTEGLINNSPPPPKPSPTIPPITPRDSPATGVQANAAAIAPPTQAPLVNDMRFPHRTNTVETAVGTLGAPSTSGTYTAMSTTVSDTPPPDVGSATNPFLQSAANASDRPKSSRVATVLYSLGCLILAVGLAGMCAYQFRDALVTKFPAQRGLALQACEKLNCVLPWSRNLDVVKIEASDLLEIPGKPGQLVLSATLANRSAQMQDYPLFEVMLTDNTNRTVTSRVFKPEQYLARALKPDEGFAPNAEIAITLNLNAGPKSLASGYNMQLVYQ